MWSPTDANLLDLYLGATSLLVLETFKFKVLITWLQIPKMIAMQSNISLSSCLYWYATLNPCRYLKSETHLWNTQVNKASSVMNGLAKICLVMDMVRNNWSRIVYCWLCVGCITSFRLVLIRFELLWILVQLKDKYFFSTPTIIHTMVHKVKKQNNSIFSLLVT